MGTENTFEIDEWGQIFKEFNRVERVIIINSADRLDISIRGREGILQASREELDDTLYKFNGNPREVATYFLRKHGIIVYYQNTLVGFFDIIGFSSFIAKNSTEDAIRHILIKDLFKSLKSNASNYIAHVKTDHWILSDSIIIVIDTNLSSLFTGSLKVFLHACSSIMRTGMTSGFPLRGAIGGGDFYKDGEMMVSSALVDAARYEKEQEWLGAVLTPKALQLVEEAKKLEIKHTGKTQIDFSSNEEFKISVRFGKIPWKPRNRNQDMVKPKETWYIKPSHMAEINWTRHLPEYFSGQEKIKNSHCLYAQE